MFYNLKFHNFLQVIVVFSDVFVSNKLYASSLFNFYIDDIEYEILEEYNDYNDTLISDLLSKNYGLHQWKLDHETELDSPLQSSYSRSGFSSDSHSRVLPSEYTEEVKLCDYEERKIYPKRMMNTNFSWQTIVNQDRARQSIRTEECMNPDKSCNYEEGFIFSANKTFCKTEYVSVELLALTYDGQLAFNSFILPHKCKCFAVNYKR